MRRYTHLLSYHCIIRKNYVQKQKTNLNLFFIFSMSVYLFVFVILLHLTANKDVQYGIVEY